MACQSILFEKRNGVAYITLNRPDEANALDLTTAKELHEVALDCERDAGVRAVLITAKGRMFCGGGDLKFFHASGDDIDALLMDVTLHFHRAISLFNRMDAPVVWPSTAPPRAANSASPFRETLCWQRNQQNSRSPIQRRDCRRTVARPICSPDLSARGEPKN